jgi:hypothetical protein
MMIIRKSNNFFLQSKQKGGVEIRCISYNHQIKNIRIAAIFDALKPLNIIHRLEAPTLLNRCLPIFFGAVDFALNSNDSPNIASPTFYMTRGAYLSVAILIFLFSLFILYILSSGCPPVRPVFPPRPSASSSCSASSLRFRRLHVVGKRELRPAWWRQRGEHELGPDGGENAGERDLGPVRRRPLGSGLTHPHLGSARRR